MGAAEEKQPSEYLGHQANFQSILQRFLKHSPSLVDAIVDQTTEEIRPHISQAEHKPILEHVFREVLRKESGSNPLSATTDRSHSIFRLITLSIELVKKDLSESTLPLALLEDTFESQTVEFCVMVFEFIKEFETIFCEWLSERPGIVMDEQMKNKKAKARLAFLRTWNGLLVRLSRTNETLFCGKILLLMAKLLPLSERSGVNLSATYNTSNNTKIDASEEAIENEGFYQAFWGVQNHFSNPVQAVSKLDTFIRDIEVILDYFSGHPLKEDEFSSESQQVISKSFVKYLTNKRIFHLQLKDNYLRRHVLLQAVIFLNCINEISGRPNAPHTMSEAQKTKTSKIRERIMELISKIPPHGQKFQEAIERIMKREKAWIHWKDTKCLPYELPPTHFDVSMSKEGVGSKRARQLETTKMLWDPPKCSSIFSERANTPRSLDDVVDALYEQSQETDLDDSDRLKNDETYRWKAMRVFVRHRYDVVPNFGGTLKRDLELVAKYIRGDLTANEQGEPAEDVAMAKSQAASSAQPAVEMKEDSKSDVAEAPGELEEGEENPDEHQAATTTIITTTTMTDEQEQ